MRSPDQAADELRPEHTSTNFNLPPDTRRLAAIRDNDTPLQMPDMWRVAPKITYDEGMEPT